MRESPIYCPGKHSNVFETTCLTELLLKFIGESNVFFILREKITSCASLLGSGVKVVFHWFFQAFILLMSLFKLIADKFVLSIAEKVKHRLQRTYDICCETV